MASLLLLVPGWTGRISSHNSLSGLSLDASDDDRLRLVWVRRCCRRACLWCGSD